MCVFCNLINNKKELLIVYENSNIIEFLDNAPINEDKSDKEETHKEQLNTFVENIPIIMNNILDNYLIKALNTNVYYQENKHLKNNDKS